MRAIAHLFGSIIPEQLFFVKSLSYDLQNNQYGVVGDLYRIWI
jgi:hypothetical protein